MKKIIYSNYTKFIAAVLFVISIVLGVITVTNGLAEYRNEKKLIYGFESDFNDTRHFSHLFDVTEEAVNLAYQESLRVVDQGEPSEETIEQNIQKKLNSLRYADRINYYVKWKDLVFTNCNASNEEELTTAPFYRLVVQNEDGHINIESSDKHYSYTWLDEIPLHDIVVCTSVKDSYVNECKALWEKQAAIVTETFAIVLICVVFALLLLIYLLCVCGKTKDGEYRSMWLDHIWTEVHLAFVGAISVGAIFLCTVLLDEYFSGHFPYYLMISVVVLSVAIASTVVITSLLSIVRNIKCKRFVESSIIVRVVKWSFKTVFRILKWIVNRLAKYGRFIFKTLTRKTGIIFISLLLIYTALIGFLGVCSAEVSSVWILVGVFLFCFAGFFVAFRAKELEEIKTGVGEVRKGNVAYQIPELVCEDMKRLATDINDIAKGFDESVSAKVKAERLKTELITNVSHDLKTPITSIVTYTELLSQMEKLPEEAKDYVSVIAKKSERLKKLTQDLFDISKVQSGNEEVIFEKLDVALLIEQSLGENDNEIRESELIFCVDTAKELYISADGRKMSRVVSNLISNALKYTMKNTRVFITAFEKDGEAVIEFKNIASYPMNFSADEIVGRFVRGDESRTTNGNGLGLAIAKSYTEICNGKFEIVVDGDMFKAILKFKKYS